MTAEEERHLRASAAHLGIALDGDAVRRLARFLELLALWSRRARLTAERERAAIIDKHVLDSLAPVPHLGEGLALDLGAGAGFPGLVIGCARPHLPLVLVDSRRQRVSFLREVVRELALKWVETIEARAEDLAQEPGLAASAATVVARAVRVDRFLALARPLLAPSGVAIAMQTPTAEAAVSAAAASEGFRVEGTHDYVLPRGERRRLFLLRLFPGKHPVS